MESTVQIRKAKATDIPQIAELLHNINWFPHLQKESIIETQNKITRQMVWNREDKCHHILIAEDADEFLLGYCAVHINSYFFLPGPEAFISELFVQEPDRGKGIGKKLLDAAIDVAKNQDCCRISLLNNRERDSYKRQFYEKSGFIERDVMANFTLKLKEY
jgi:GNAT superfamily N-acetyltransferase